MSKLSRAAILAFASSLTMAAPFTVLPSISQAQVIGAAITVAPLPLPVYAQPAIPAPGYIWVPGYWAWANGGYYWVPGTWVLPPAVGLLWTPGYWAWLDGGYFWHAGYWGPHVGFYGGIDYGFGYNGVGYVGGHWDHGQFFYNRTVNNFGGIHITNVYAAPVHNVAVTRVSFNGGNGGTQARPTAGEMAAAREHHVAPTPLQLQHQHAASANHAFFASVNHGRPPIAATARPAAFTAHASAGARPQQRPPQQPVHMAQAGAGAAHRSAPPTHAPPHAQPHAVHVARAGAAPAHRPAPQPHAQPHQQAHAQPRPQPHPVRVAQAGGHGPQQVRR